MDQPLIVVLPMHNCERHLRSSVLDILEFTHSPVARIEIVIVDDGSTDETYETACELTRTYPQVKVLRQPVRRGFDAALDLVRRRLSVEMVIVHDGVSPVDASQLKSLLQTSSRRKMNLHAAEIPGVARSGSVGSRRLTSLRPLHNAMERAHRSALGFAWTQLEKPLIPRRRTTSYHSLPISIPSAAGNLPAPMAPTL